MKRRFAEASPSRRSLAPTASRWNLALTRWRRHALGMLRVGGVMAVLTVIATTWSVHRAKAETGRQAIRIGRELAPLADLLDGNHRISLNGEEIMLANGFTKDSVGRVLDRFEEHCRENTGPVSAILTEGAPAAKSVDAPKSNATANANANATANANKAAAAQSPTAQAGQTAPAGQAAQGDWATVRDEKDGEGTVVCLAKNGDRKPLDALRSFAETRDLGDLGKLRYVFARPTEEGNTRLLVLWTEGSFHLDNLVSEAEGRVPEDTREVPRPPDSTFLFDARIKETPYGTRVYRSKKSPEDVAGFYDKDMAGRGWDGVAPPSPKGVVRGFIREGVQVILGAVKDDESGETIVSLSETGGLPGWTTGDPRALEPDAFLGDE